MSFLASKSRSDLLKNVQFHVSLIHGSEVCDISLSSLEGDRTQIMFEGINNPAYALTDIHVCVKSRLVWVYILWPQLVNTIWAESS